MNIPGQEQKADEAATVDSMKRAGVEREKDPGNHAVTFRGTFVVVKAL